MFAQVLLVQLHQLSLNPFFVFVDLSHVLPHELLDIEVLISRAASCGSVLRVS